MEKSEIHLSVVIAALEQLLHLLHGGLAGIGAGAGVADGVDGDVMEPLQEHLLGHKTLVAGIAVRAVLADAVGDVQVVVQLAQERDQIGDLLIQAVAAQVDEVGNLAVPLGGGLVLGVAGGGLRS